MRIASRRPSLPASPAITGMFVLFGLVIASFFPFFALFLSGRGLSPSEIGLVVAAMAIVRIGANPIWGSLADARIGRRRVVQMGLVGGIAAALVLSWLGHDLAGVLVPAVVLAAFNGQIGPNIDALALVSLGEHRMSDYGRIRAWESFSYAIACIAFGALLQATGVTWLMSVNAGAMAAVLLWSSTLPPDRPARRIHHGRMGTVGAVFRESPRFWGFLAGAFILWTGFNAAWNFFALRVEIGGGGPLLVGIGTSLGGAIEVGMMLWSPRLLRRVGLRHVYAAGAVVYAVTFLLWGLVSDPVAVALLAAFEGCGFSLLFTSSVVIVGRLVPEGLYSTGQSMSSTASFGVAPIVGGALGGLLFQHLGPLTLYVGASVLALIGGAVVWLTLSGPAFTRPATAAGTRADLPAAPIEAPAPRVDSEIAFEGPAGGEETDGRPGRGRPSA
jgi:PPP family 3-phenylpropionic acid transporter